MAASTSSQAGSEAVSSERMDEPSALTTRVTSQDSDSNPTYHLSESASAGHEATKDAITSIANERRPSMHTSSGDEESDDAKSFASANNVQGSPTVGVAATLAGPHQAVEQDSPAATPLEDQFSSVSLDEDTPISSNHAPVSYDSPGSRRASMETPATLASTVTDAESHNLEEAVPLQDQQADLDHNAELGASQDSKHSLLKHQLDAYASAQTNEASVFPQEAPRWRDSTAEGTVDSVMDSVELSDSRPVSESVSSVKSVNVPISVSLSTQPSSNTDGSNLGATDSSMARSPTRQSTTSSSHNYDLIQQRAESHHAELEEHPKRRRRTLRASEDLRHNFEKLRVELSSPSPKSPGIDQPTMSQAQDSHAIDWDFWGEVVSDYEGVAKSRPRDLSRAIQNGIPPALRGMMWQLMSASKDAELEATYSQLMRLPSAHEKAIIRDLNRTFPTHEYFHDKAGVGQVNLLNIMKAYSLYDDEVGYCQGMAFVVGPLLLNMPDEEAFCVLVRLMKSYDLRSQYIPDMPGLQLRLYQFDRLLEELLPAVFMHLLRQGIKSSMYASQWFLTLLAYRFPLELVCSVFDLIFAEGVEAIFRFALAVMKRNEAKIVQLEFEQLLDFLKTGLFEDYKHQLEAGADDNAAPTYSVRTFVKEALQVKITPMMLDQYTSEWTEMCRQQSAQSAEVEQLRNINKKLSNQVRHLEASLAQINNEHCDLVKQVVATRLEKEELEDELVRVKMALAQESLLREEGRGSIASRGSYASYTSSPGPRSPENERRDSQLSLSK